MAIFVVIAQPGTNADRLPNAVQVAYRERNLSVAPGVWLVSDQGTPLEVSNRLGVTEGVNGGAIITEVAGFNGWAAPPVWDWFRAYWSLGSRG